MRSYGHYCSVAKALDVVGDRWSLLIVRELLLREPCRYTDLQRGLPGIATNLLADRLRELEDAGILAHEHAPPPTASTLYRLTPWGRELEAVLVALGRWGTPLMSGSADGLAFRSRWLELPVRLLLGDSEPSAPAITIEVHAGDEPMTIEAGGGVVRARPGSAEHPRLVLSGAPQLVVGVLAGRLELEEACARGMSYEGDPGALARVQGQAVAA